MAVDGFEQLEYGDSTSPSLTTLANCVGFLFVSTAVLLGYYVFVYPFHGAPLRNIPGPKNGSIFFGQCQSLLNTDWIPNLFCEWSRQWPESPFIRYLGFANSEGLVVNSVNAYRQILRSKDDFVKPAATRQSFRPILGDGLPFAEGLPHRHRKAVLMRSFNASQIKSMLSVMQGKARQLVDVLDSNLTPSDETEAESLVWKTVLDIISIDILGVDLNHLGSNTSPLYDLFGKMTRQSLLGHVLHYLGSYLPLKTLLPDGYTSTLSQSCARSRAYLRRFLETRRQSGVNILSQPRAIYADTLQQMIGEPSLWSEEEAVEYLLNLFILGHDTTACTIVWAIHLLSEHRQFQHRLRQEIKTFLKPQKGLSYDSLTNFPFLNNFLREVLRLYCPVAYIPREAVHDVKVDGVLLPKGTIINLCPAVVNLHPLVWGSDAAKFNPDRWNHLSDKAADAYAFESFHHGPRACIGQQLAMTEMKIILVEIITRFDISAAASNAPIKFASPSFTLRPKELLHVRLCRIDGESGCE